MMMSDGGDGSDGDDSDGDVMVMMKKEKRNWGKE